MSEKKKGILKLVILTVPLAGAQILLKEDGKAYSAGLNSYGQLGIGNTTDTSTLTQISIDTNSKIKYIARIIYTTYKYIYYCTPWDIKIVFDKFSFLPYSVYKN